jgi:PAS domain S-box-containing protein
MREQRHYICNDIRTDPAIRPWKEEAMQRGYRSSMALPIYKFGEPFGIFQPVFRRISISSTKKRSGCWTRWSGISLLRWRSLKKKSCEKGGERDPDREAILRFDHQYAAGCISICMTRKLHFLRWNNRFEEASGYSSEEFAEMTVLDFFQGSQRELIQNKTETVFVTGRCDVEAELTTRSGENVPFYFSGTKITYRDKPCVLGIGFDIARLKEAENLLRQSEEDLRDLASTCRMSGKKSVPLSPGRSTTSWVSS